MVCGSFETDIFARSNKIVHCSEILRQENKRILRNCTGAPSITNGIVRYCVVLYYIAWYCIAYYLLCVALYCTLLLLHGLELR